MNKPVAWMVDGVLFNSLGAALNISFDIEQPCIPLYTHPAKDNYRETHEGFSTVIDATHPAKTLTDEEIWELSDMVLKNSDVIGFARAILKKAQEK